MWNMGMSVSSGCYLLPQAAGSLPRGNNIGDFREKGENCNTVSLTFGAALPLVNNSSPRN
jgi:hypothetical protein